MISFIKLLYDTSLYTALAMCYYRLFAGSELCAGFLPVLAVSAFFAALSGKKPLIRVLSLLIPLTFLAFTREISQLLTMLPVYLYLIYCILSGRTVPDAMSFRPQLRFGFALLAAFFAPFLFTDNAMAAFSSAAPYIILYLALGVVIMRYVREEDTRPDLGRQLAVVLPVTAAAVAAAALRLPKYLGKLLGFVYNKAIAPALVAVAMCFYGVAAMLWSAIRFLLSLLRGSPAEEAAQEMEQGVESFKNVFQETAGDTPLWIYIAIGVFMVAVAILLLVLLFRKLLGDRKSPNTAGKVTVSHEGLDFTRPKSGIFRADGEAGAIRRCYRLFLKKIIRSGVAVERHHTTELIAKNSAAVLPDSQRDVAVLRENYIMARYSTKKLPENAVSQAKSAWLAIKNTKSAEEK